MSDSVIIIPTYNEIENVENMTRTVMAFEKDFHILYVDDNSPDGTADKVIEDVQEVLRKADVGQDEAIWDIKSEYPMLPVAISCMTDTHWGSTRVNNSLLNQHLDLIESTPNFGMVTNGDHIDNLS